MFRTVANAWLSLAFASALAAQQRQPLLGRVVDKDGAPVAAAKVTLVEDDADLAGIDPVDVVAVTTDDKGRFVAQALRGVRYTALAVGPEVDGKAMVARPVPDLACGRPCELRLVQQGLRRRAVLAGLEPWGATTDLRVRPWQELSEWRSDAPVTLRLEPLPAMRVRVLGPDGAPLAGARFEIGEFRQGLPGRAGQDRLLTELGWNAFADCVRRWTTDERGDAVVRALSWPNATPTLYAWHGDYQHRSADVPFAPGDDVHELKLQR